MISLEYVCVLIAGDKKLQKQTNEDAAKMQEEQGIRDEQKIEEPS